MPVERSELELPPEIARCAKKWAVDWYKPLQLKAVSIADHLTADNFYAGTTYISYCIKERAFSPGDKFSIIFDIFDVAPHKQHITFLDLLQDVNMDYIRNQPNLDRILVISKTPLLAACITACFKNPNRVFGVYDRQSGENFIK